jgi:hypothetical protein
MKKKTLTAVFAVTITAIVTALVLNACASTGGGKEPESELVVITGSYYKAYYISIQDQEGKVVFPRSGELYRINPEKTVTVPLQNGKYTIFHTNDSDRELKGYAWCQSPLFMITTRFIVQIRKKSASVKYVIHQSTISLERTCGISLLQDANLPASSQGNAP